MEPGKITSLIEDIKSLLKQIVDAWYTRDWYKLLPLLFAVDFIAANPAIMSELMKFFDEKLVSWYFKTWILSLIFFGAITIVGAFLQSRKQDRVPTPPDNSAIKGLIPFDSNDVDVFSRLQRHDNLRECVNKLTDSDFRFGILFSESGCGKTSFLQAGILPKLRGDSAAIQRCVYVKFTDLDPLESVKIACIDQLKVPILVEKEVISFLSFLEQLLQQDSKPIVLLFDQFEQYLLRAGEDLETDSFAKDLAQWYQKRPLPAIRILVSLREDYLGQMVSLQKVLGYSLSPQDVFQLKKFTPTQTASIFQVIAGEGGLTFDGEFIKRIASRELASSDGLISPVDIQILAWMLMSQQNDEAKAFTEQAFRQLGGVDGLLERFLIRSIRVRETPERREAAVKVLLALTDLEHNVRAGVLTKEALQLKLQGSLTEENISEALNWLENPGVRLIASVAQAGFEGYELVHERLIFALRKVAGIILTGAEDATQLLDRRVNEWLANKQTSRFLLSWNEWRLIERYRPQIAWGSQREYKEQLLILTKSRWLRFLGIVVGIFAIILTTAVWYQMPQGQIWRVRQDMVNLGNIRPNDIETQSFVAKAYMLNDDSAAAMRHVDQLPSAIKSEVLQDMAEEYIELHKVQFANTALAKSTELVGIQPGEQGVRILVSIAESYIELSEPKLADFTLIKARKIAVHLPNISRNDALNKINEVYKSLNEPKGQSSIADLEKMLQVGRGLSDYEREIILINVTSAYSKNKKIGLDAATLNKAIDLVPRIGVNIKKEILEKIIAVCPDLYNKQSADTCLNKVLQYVNDLNGNDKCYELIALTKAYSKLHEVRLANSTLNAALEFSIHQKGTDKGELLAIVGEACDTLADVQSANNILFRIRKNLNDVPDMYLSWVMSHVANAYSKLNEGQLANAALNQSMHFTQEVPNYLRDKLLSYVTDVYVDLHKGRATDISLNQALQWVSQLPNFEKSRVLIWLAEAYAIHHDMQTAKIIMDTAMQWFEQIPSEMKVEVLPKVVYLYAREGNWKKARLQSQLIEEEKRAVILYKILVAWNKGTQKQTSIL